MKEPGNYGFKRFVNVILLYSSQFGLLPPSWKVKCVQMAGVNFIDASDVFLGAEVSFDNVYPWNITIGRRATITEGVKILSHFLDVDKPPFSFHPGKVVIGDNVFIGSNSIIAKECTIGNNVVIAAGSVVTKDIPDNWIVGGVPAKKIGERCNEPIS